MKEANIKRLEEELKYLVKEERVKEINNYDLVLANDNPDIKKIAKEIYLRRGLDYDKLHKGFFNNLMDTITEFGTLFKSKKSDVKGKMIRDIIIMVLLLVLLKIPFDFVRDIGFDYIDVLTTNNTFYTIWNLAFLILYTIVFICTFIVLIRNFNNIYRNS